MKKRINKAKNNQQGKRKMLTKIYKKWRKKNLFKKHLTITVINFKN